MNKTPNYQLNQWDADDRVLRTDFNADNAKLDAVLGTLSGRISDGVRLAVGHYVGDGTLSITLPFADSLGRPPKVLAIRHSTGIALYLWENPTSSTVTITGQFSHNIQNNEGLTYYYFALG